MKYFLTSFLISICTVVFSQGVSDSRKNEIVFQNVNVIPMDRNIVLENQTVVVKNGKIISVTESSKSKIGKDAMIVDGSGKYLMPGLAEMHGHVPPVDDLDQMKEVLMLFALHGITTVRGMLGHPKHLQLREMIRKQEIIAPDFYASGPSVNGQSASSPQEAIAMVKQQKKDGYDYVKIHPGLSKEAFNAMAKTAHEVGIPFVGHISFDVGIWKSIEAGYSSIDHLDGFIEGLVPGIENMRQEEVGLFGVFIADKAEQDQIPKLMQALKNKNVWVVPTQALAERWMSPVPLEEFVSAPEMKYMNKEIRQQWADSKINFLQNPRYDKEKVNDYIDLRRQIIKACQEQGVGLLLGCDAPQVFNVPGISTHHELQYLVDSGLSPFEALQTGTINVAKYLNKTADSGTIKAGSKANLVLLGGNPLQDIGQSKNIEGVCVGGKYLPKSFIDSELKKLEK